MWKSNVVLIKYYIIPKDHNTSIFSVCKWWFYSVNIIWYNLVKINFFPELVILSNAITLLIITMGKIK